LVEAIVAALPALRVVYINFAAWDAAAEQRGASRPSKLRVDMFQALTELDRVEEVQIRDADSGPVDEAWGAAVSNAYEDCERLSGEEGTYCGEVLRGVR
jgi:hypothetical protein